ncbi:MAG: 16S rRNA (cytidine(1402)-2'-O)-methyltransferase [Acidobacteria bacterium]|nr:16S rRNA (cytidine(1402)-2'-O)-methyltransferase [Acidobacteriota bacterium]
MGRFFFVSTPIGNLKDISYRAVEVLQSSDVIFCEDTRHSLKLLKHYRIEKHLESFHDFSDESRLQKIRLLLEEGRTLSYISDAGTPLLSDPGFEIVRFFNEQNIEYDVIPGASALLPALQLSGMPTDRFFFAGFLPRKENEIRKILASLAQIPATLVFYQSPLRIRRSLKVMAEEWPGRQIAVVKELTKLHQKVARGRAEKLAERFGDAEKGEFVLVAAPPEPNAGDMDDAVLRQEFGLLISCDIPRKQAARFLAKKYKLNGKELYRRSLEW